MTEGPATRRWLAEVFLETRWQRSEPVDQAWFPEERGARGWVATVLERLRVRGEMLGGEDAVCYLAEVRHVAEPGGLVCTAYLLDPAAPLDWDEWDETSPDAHVQG